MDVEGDLELQTEKTSCVLPDQICVTRRPHLSNERRKKIRHCEKKTRAGWRAAPLQLTFFFCFCYCHCWMGKIMKYFKPAIVLPWCDISVYNIEHHILFCEI